MYYTQLSKKSILCFLEKKKNRQKVFPCPKQNLRKLKTFLKNRKSSLFSALCILATVILVALRKYLLTTLIIHS